jgi:hypothetical protein
MVEAARADDVGVIHNAFPIRKEAATVRAAVVQVGLGVSGHRDGFGQKRLKACSAGGLDGAHNVSLIRTPDSRRMPVTTQPTNRNEAVVWSRSVIGCLRFGFLHVYLAPIGVEGALGGRAIFGVRLKTQALGAKRLDRLSASKTPHDYEIAVFSTYLMLVLCHV